MPSSSPRGVLHGVVRRLLSPAEVSVNIAASPEKVFAVLSDPETYPEWLAGAQRIRHVDPSFPRPGAEFDHEVGPTEDATMADDSTALVVDPPHRLQLKVNVGPVTGLVDFQLEATGEGTRITFRESTMVRWPMPCPYYGSRFTSATRPRWSGSRTD